MSITTQVTPYGTLPAAAASSRRATASANVKASGFCARMALI